MNEFAPRSTNKAPARFDAEAVARAELDRGERLVWTGQPVAKRMMRTAFVIYVFAIPWTAFALFWEVMAIGMFFDLPVESEGNPGRFFSIIFPLFGLPFVLVGFWMLSTPFRLYVKAKKMVYAITNQRALVIEEGKVRKVVSHPFKQIGKDIFRKDLSDGSGSLIFTSSLKSIKMEKNDPLAWLKNGFVHVRDVRRVEGILRRAINNHEAGGTANADSTIPSQ